MSSAAPGRVAVICLAMLSAAAVPARAGEFLHKLFHCTKDCGETQRVTLPAQQVEVVTEQPRVIVRETAARSVHRTAAVGVVPLATVYMPMTVPLPMMFPMVGAHSSAALREVTESVERNPLEVAHRAEVMALRSEQAKSELQATLEAHQRVLQRMAGGPSRVSGGSDCSASNVEQRLNLLTSELQQLNNRVASVERLLSIHDNVLKSKVVASPGTRTPAEPSPSPEESKTPSSSDEPKLSTPSQPGSPPPMIPPGRSPAGTPPPASPPPMIK